MNSTRFFRQAAADQFIGSMAYLESQQSLFQRDQTSGMIEVQIRQADWAVLLFACGVSTGIYHLGEDQCKPITISELQAIWLSSKAPISTQVLPDTAACLAWLRLESQARSTFKVMNQAEWETWLQERRTEKCNGLVQVASEFFDGFVYLKDGKVVKPECIFSTGQGFETILPFFQYTQNVPCELSLYSAPAASPAHKTFVLRRGVSDWTHLILNRYREMVGQRMLQILVEQSNKIIEPWEWKIQLEGTYLWDQHFFPNLGTAVKAYRALIVSMGTQSSMMIGSGLSQRLVSETYNQLGQGEKEILESQRLIPAALA